MIRQPKTVLAIIVLLTAVAGGWLVLAPAAVPVRADMADATLAEGSGVIDGLTFASELGPLDKPANVKDSLVFENGMFVSRECQRRCDYPPAPYFVRRVGDKTEFIAETHCSDKDSTIVWRGTVDDVTGTVKGVFTWTASRWYWTIEKEFWFEGRLAEGTVPMAGDAGVPMASDQ